MKNRKKITFIIRGTSARLVSEDIAMQKKVKAALNAGVHITACKACSDQPGATETLKKNQYQSKIPGLSFYGNFNGK